MWWDLLRYCFCKDSNPSPTSKRYLISDLDINEVHLILVCSFLGCSKQNRDGSQSGLMCGEGEPGNPTASKNPFNNLMEFHNWFGLWRVET